MSHRYALITGASSGIGLELARLFAQDGYGLILAARSAGTLHDVAAELEQAYDVPTLVIPADLSDPRTPEQIYASVESAGLQVEVLVNNAGYAVYAPFAETDLKGQMDMIQVNTNALTHLTGLFLPDMVERRSGKILNVASTAAFQPGPLMAVYYATKAFVLSFSEGLANELKGTGITVTALCPGPTRTGFEARAKLEESKLFKSRVMDAGAVAKAGFDGLMKGETLVIPGASNKLLAWSVRLMPRKAVPSLVRKFQDKVKG